MTESEPTAEKIAKMLFTGSDGAAYSELLQMTEQGSDGMHMN